MIESTSLKISYHIPRSQVSKTMVYIDYPAYSGMVSPVVDASTAVADFDWADGFPVGLPVLGSNNSEIMARSARLANPEVSSGPFLE